MQNNGVIIFVEDDPDDIEIISRVLEDIGSKHELINYSTLDKAFDYIITHKEKPFLIMCDNNYRNKNKEKLSELITTNGTYKMKAIPFVFFSTEIDNKLVNEAYGDLNVQGFFQKGNNFDKITHDIKVILDYWETTIHPI